MNQTAEDLLNSNDYFFCERMRCTLKKEICLKRQKGQNTRWGSREGSSIFEECKNCEQGKQVKKELSQPTKKQRSKVVGKKMEKQKSEALICEVCGEIFKPYKIGKFYAKKICRRCRNEKIRKGHLKRTYAPPKEQNLGKVVPRQETVDEHVITLSFGEHKELYSYLIERARLNFRTPEMEIMALLDREKEKNNE